jgi:hypothetical protein
VDLHPLLVADLLEGGPDERRRARADPEPWMGLAGLWMGSAGLSIDFSFFVFYLIYRGGHLNCLGKDGFTGAFV